MNLLETGGLIANPATSSRAPILATPNLQGLSVSTQTYSSSGGATLPVWNFTVRSSRDKHQHSGTIVGTSPFNNPQSTAVPVQIVPLVIKTHTLGTSFDPTTGIISTAPGDSTTDPTDPQSTCLTAPNNVPLRLLE